MDIVLRAAIVFVVIYILMRVVGRRAVEHGAVRPDNPRRHRRLRSAGCDPAGSVGHGLYPRHRDHRRARRRHLVARLPVSPATPGHSKADPWSSSKTVSRSRATSPASGSHLEELAAQARLKEIDSIDKVLLGGAGDKRRDRFIEKASPAERRRGLRRTTRPRADRAS